MPILESSGFRSCQTSPRGVCQCHVICPKRDERSDKIGSGMSVFRQMYCFGSIVSAEQVLLPAHGDGMEDRSHRNGNGRWMEESFV